MKNIDMVILVPNAFPPDSLRTIPVSTKAIKIFAEFKSLHRARACGDKDPQMFASRSGHI